LLEWFGKIIQDKESISVSSKDTSVSKSKQLDSAILPSKIAALLSGEFIALVADDPGQKIKLKLFHCEILNDHESNEQETKQFKKIPAVREITTQEIQDNYMQVKLDVGEIIRTEMETLKELKKTSMGRRQLERH
jgi:hypothetical protein